jgi:hypothetical protein
MDQSADCTDYTDGGFAGADQRDERSYIPPTLLASKQWHTTPLTLLAYKSK